jgi:hypothetical protein
MLCAPSPQAGSVRSSKTRPIEFAERQIQNLRCAACHPRDQQLSTWAQLENDLAPLTAAAPTATTEAQPVAGTWAPMLTWVGEKLPARMARTIRCGQDRLQATALPPRAHARVTRQVL